MMRAAIPLVGVAVFLPERMNPAFILGPFGISNADSAVSRPVVSKNTIPMRLLTNLVLCWRMLDEPSTGQVLDNPIAAYALCTIAIISVALWFWGRYERRTHEQKKHSENKQDN